MKLNEFREAFFKIDFRTSSREDIVLIIWISPPKQTLLECGKRYDNETNELS